MIQYPTRKTPYVKVLAACCGWRQYEIARELRFDGSTLSKILNGIAEPTAEQRKKLCAFFQQPANALFRNVSPEEVGFHE